MAAGCTVLDCSTCSAWDCATVTSSPQPLPALPPQGDSCLPRWPADPKAPPTAHRRQARFPGYGAISGAGRFWPRFALLSLPGSACCGSEPLAADVCRPLGDARALAMRRAATGLNLRAEQALRAVT